jgi:hypothetical protein
MRIWSELSLGQRRLIIIGGLFEGLLKVSALIDLARRPATEVRGSKTRWGVTVVLINSVGIAPLAYFIFGRTRKPGARCSR